MLEFAVGDVDVFELEQIARAVELGIGVGSPGQIEIVTPGGDSEAYAEKLTGILTTG